MAPQTSQPASWRARKPAQGSKSLAYKNHLVAMIGEFVGTTLFIIFCLGGTHVALLDSTTVTGNLDVALNTSSLFYISLSFGLSLTVNVWIFARVSGGLFNPAVSLGMVLAGAITPLRGALLSFAQILGGMTGAAIIDALVPGHLNAGTSLGAGASIAQGLFIEVFLTALLMLTILFLAAEKHQGAFMAPLGIGMALFVSEIVGVIYTGGSLNPARSFGPAVATHDFPGYHWIYWVGPCLGAALAAGFYKLLKWLEYETVFAAPEEEVLPTTAAAGKDFSVSSGTQTEDEKSNPASGTMAVTGPGLDGLLTRRGDDGSDGKVNERLERIETLLAQLVHTKQPVEQSLA